MDHKNIGFASLVAGVVASAPLSSALAVEFEPRVSVGVALTDNVALAPTEPVEETTYILRPSFKLNHETDRIQVNADYLLDAFYYQDLGEDELYHQYQANVRGEIIEESIFLDVGTQRTQTIVDPRDTLPADNLPVTGNRQDRDETYISPSFQFVTGNSIAFRGDYRVSWLEFGNAGLQGATNHGANFSVDNYERGTGATWAVRYNWGRAIYDLSPPWENQRAIAEVGFWVSSNMRLFASGGLESSWDTPLDPTLEDEIWEAGFAYRAGERANFEAAAGERSFGSSWRAELEFALRTGEIAISYNQAPTTQSLNPFEQGIAGQSLVGVGDPIGDNDLLTNPGNAERFISEVFDVRISFDLRRTTLRFSYYDRLRTDRTTPLGEPLADEKQRGVTASVGYSIGRRTGIDLRATAIDREFEANNGDTAVFAQFSVNYELGANTGVSLQYSYADEETDTPSVGRNYTANTVALMLSRDF